MDLFLLGALTLANAIVGLFFLRFWRQTGERLFAIFALSFLILGLSRLLIAVMGEVDEVHTTLVYLLRLLAYLLILAAVLDRNVFRKKSAAAPP
jgi:hypothetical protein